MWEQRSDFEWRSNHNLKVLHLTTDTSVSWEELSCYKLSPWTWRDMNSREAGGLSRLLPRTDYYCSAVVYVVIIHRKHSVEPRDSTGFLLAEHIQRCLRACSRQWLESTWRGISKPLQVKYCWTWRTCAWKLSSGEWLLLPASGEGSSLVE